VKKRWFVVQPIVAILSSNHLYDEVIADHFEVPARRLGANEQTS